jgi:hypothetical protein
MIRTIAAICVTCVALPAISQEPIHPVLKDKFTFKLGALENKADGKITATRPPLPEIPVDLDTLGIEDGDITPWGAFRWRFGERWALNFMFNRYDQDSEVYILDEFNYEGEVYPVGLGVSTELKADAYIMDVSYAFIKKANQEFGGGVGIHAFDLQAGITAGGFIGDIGGVTPPAQSEELIAPVPNLRLYYLYAFNSRVHMKLDAGWLSASYEDYDGSFSYAGLSAEYRFTERFGAGLGYQYTDIDVEHDKGEGSLTEFDMSFDSFQFYLTYSF